MKFKSRLLIIFIIGVILLIFLNNPRSYFNEKTKKFYPNSINTSYLSHLVELKLNDAEFLAKIQSNPSDKQKLQRLANQLKHRMRLPYVNLLDIWKIPKVWVNINGHELYPFHAPEMAVILEKLSTAPIVHSDVSKKGTQLKLSFVLDGNQRVIFKPQRYKRDAIIRGEPYAGADRHNGEIVAFHLSRLLDFRLVPITAGRRVHIREIKSVASLTLLSTFLPENPDCFIGRCLYCSRKFPLCPDSYGLIEGSVILLIPEKYPLKKLKHPWQRTYKKSFALWELDPNYCDNIKKKLPSDRLLDLIDTSIFDFLIGNADRHHYEVFDSYIDSPILLIDNGKSFGNPSLDELSIIAPLYQCCTVRKETHQRLLILNSGNLINALNILTRDDPLYPLLTDDHLEAILRRIKKVLAIIDICVDLNGSI